MLQEDERKHAKGRKEADVEATVAIKVRGIIAIQSKPLLLNNKHWYLGAVLRWKEDLLRLVEAGIEPSHSAATYKFWSISGSVQVTPEGAAWIEKRRELKEKLVVVMASPQYDAANTRKRQLPSFPSGEVIQYHLMLHIAEILDHERGMISKHGVFELRSSRRLWDHLLPQGWGCCFNVCPHDPLPWSILVRSEVEGGPFV
mmetsp:Transcript_7105/g.15315  ORF Transcript_7105/g.15315 Transcript_7105/m.15315 type:complete len:201 (-) Transcript_7105:997-1599(-)